MKKISIIIVLFVSSAKVFAQWTVLTSGVTNTLRAPYFFDEQNGFVVGEPAGGNSPILKTSDGGITWSTINSGTTEALRAITFIDADTGFIAGFAGTILKSIDSGNTWTSIASGTTQPLRSISFPSHDTGYVAGGHGIILKTVDAGVTWFTLDAGIDSDIINIRFADNNTGYAVSCGAATSDFNKGYIIKTVDGGATWSTVYYNGWDGLLGLAVPGSNAIYAGGKDDIILKSTDQGTTWIVSDSGLVTHRIRGSFFVNDIRGWMICDVGDIFYTPDGGTTWANQSVNITGLFGIYFPSDSVGYACGNLGEILKYGPCSALSPVDTIDGLTFEICPNDTLLYGVDSVAGATNYAFGLPAGATIAWGNGSTLILVAFTDQSGYISVTVSSECDAVYRQDFITVHTLPVPVITFDGVFLTSSSATTYQWRIGGSLIGGATNQSYIPVVNGIYTVDVTNDFGCEATSSPFNLTAVGLNELSTNAALEVFPNPVVIAATIIVSGNSSQQYLSISDVQGKILREMAVSPNQRITIERTDFREGMYFISLLNENHELISRSKLVMQ